ncbi:hypothetical protein FHU41_002232 [Psychromicrobium silvestre]|uniref:Uncharacterized protein n=1 Tax=Psychromicrobium silvestre TaxID=1645614 RepID=A0A7Y9LUQ9_9MICC|nr:hypothetical protein [Psychromicrobium silvestre]NYE95982.1 hypothetical protein [Psychromicrobium silvestre]
MNRNQVSASASKLSADSELLSAWRRLSEMACWREPDDWLIPEVEVFAQALLGEGDIERAALLLGAARALLGVGVVETVEDLRCAYVAAAKTLDIDSIQAMLEGWSANFQLALGDSCTDPSTGLATIAHLERLLLDHCASAELEESKVLAAIKLPVRLNFGTAPTGWALKAELGSASLLSLTATSAVVAYSDHAVLILMPRTIENLTKLARCQEAIEEISPALKGQTRLECELAPSLEREIPLVLARLCR